MLKKTKIKLAIIISIALLSIVIATSWIKYSISDHTTLPFGNLIHRVETDEKVIALTFDDGPKPKRTEQILAILKQENIKATFYLNGKHLKKNPIQTKLLVESGHQLANHSYSHKRMAFMPYKEIAQEIESTTKILRDYGYQDELHFRPPYGKMFINLGRYLANNDITAITWDVEPETWSEPIAGTQEKIQRAMEQIRPGSIILMHVMLGNTTSMEATPVIIQKLKAKGYRFVTVSELLKYQTSKR